MQTDLRDLIASFEREAKVPSLDADGRRELEQDITEAKRAAGELVRRISNLERRISNRAAEDSAGGTAVGGGHDLY